MQNFGGLNFSDIFEDAEDLRLISNMSGDELIHFLLLQLEDYKKKLHDEQQTKGSNLLAVERLEEEYNKIVMEKDNL